MTERYSFAVDRQLVDSSMVWNQDNIENSTLTDTMNESYATAEEDSPTRYLSVLDATTDISLENLNITLSNPKLEVEDAITYTEEVPEQPEETGDQVVVFNVEGSDELYGIQVVQDEEGNLQKYQFQFRKNENGHLEAIPETITLIPMEEGVPEEVQEVVEDVEYAAPVEDNTAVHVYVQEDNSNEHILPDNHVEDDLVEPLGEEETVMYESEDVEEEHVDIKPAVLQLQNVKQEDQDYDTPNLMEEETFASNLETQQIRDFQVIQEPPETSFEYDTPTEDHAPAIEENSLSSDLNVEECQDSQPPQIPDSQDFEHVEVSPDMNAVQTMQNLDEEEEEETEDFSNETTMNDSDENDYHIVEGLHITGDVEGSDVAHQMDKPPNSNILKHALKTNTESPKIVKKDNKLYFYVVQHPEKENVDSLSLELSNLCRSKVNPRSILKSSHAMFQPKNEIEANAVQDERLNKRFARCKEAMQAMLFHNFINKTTIPQAPVRKNRLPRKQKIKPVERMDEEIVVQEMMVSNNGFVETGIRGVNKENLAITEYVDLTDSDDDYDPKRSARKKKRHRRKRVEITISDESDASYDSVIELDESDDETTDEPKATNNNTPTKRRRGRPPKDKSSESSSPSTESPAKKTKVEPIDNPTKPEIPCPKCDKTFPSQNSLKTHLQHHNLQSSIKRALPEYKYKCDKCATAFINNILLKKHMCSKLFNCLVCKKSFPDLSSLNGHKRTHAKEQMVKSTTAVQVSPKKMKPVLPTNTFKAPRTSNLKCKTCGKLCSSLQNLNVHMKTHKEFICGTCSKSFVSLLMLEKHIRENCVKSPQNNRRSMRIKSAGDERKRLQVTPPKLRSKSVASSGKKLQERRMAINLKVKCEQCSLCFGSHQALFKHKVVEHGVETPDKSVLEKEERQQRCKGSIPAGKKLLNSFAGINCQLEFNE